MMIDEAANRCAFDSEVQVVRRLPQELNAARKHDFLTVTPELDSFNVHLERMGTQSAVSSVRRYVL